MAKIKEEDKKVSPTTGSAVPRPGVSIAFSKGTATPGPSLRNPSKSADHWTNADYGANFAKSDIGRLQEKGYSNNQIMKIAQLAYAAGDAAKVNKTNKALYELSGRYLDKATPSITVKGQTLSGSPYGIDRIGDPKKVLGWNGFGNGMTINNREINGYNQTGVWSLPTKFTPQGRNDTGPFTPPQVKNDPGPPPPPQVNIPIFPSGNPVEIPKQEDGPIAGGGSAPAPESSQFMDSSLGIASATGVRRRRSSWDKAGKRSQGTSNLNRGLTITGYNIK